MPERRPVTRRACLRALGGAVGGASLAGCQRLGGGDATATPRESRCSDGDTPAAAVYDDWFLRFEPGEFTAPTLALTTANPRTLTEFPEVLSVAAPFLRSTRQYLERLRLPFRALDRVAVARPSPEARPAYVVCRQPGSPADREAWLERLGFRTYVSEEPDYRSFARRSVRWPSVDLVAFDDEHVVVTPEATDDVALDAPSRGERLVDTHLDDEHPVHCYRPDVAALVERLPANDLVALRIRTGDDTFGPDHVRAPTGARASAFSVRLRWSGRDRVLGGETPTEAGSVTATESATETAAPEEPTAELGLVVVFPPGEPSVDAVRTHVAERRSATDGGSGLRFDEPAYDRTGRVVTVSEHRPVAALTE